jgi:FkbM family methyltransferase
MFAGNALRLLRTIACHPANAGRRVTALVSSIRWQIRKRVNSAPLSVKIHGTSMLCWPDSEQSSNIVYFNGYPDFWEMSFLRGYLREGDNVVDIGANVGVYTVMLSRAVGEQGSVTAFEADPHTMSRLREQISQAGLSNVSLHECAVSDKSGELTFSSVDSAAMRHISRSPDTVAAGNKVRCVALDHFKPWKKFDVVKLDIEGAEPLVFVGANERFQQCPPDVLLFEVSGLSKGYGYSTEEVISLLERFNYKTAIYDVSQRQLRWTREPWKTGDTNLLAIHSTATQKVESRLSTTSARR